MPTNPDLNLVIEYRERQHTEPIALFDQRMTVSGIGGGQQRALYDQRRRDVLPTRNIALLEVGYDDFAHDGQKRLVRVPDADRRVVEDLLRHRGVSPRNP